MFYLSRYWSEVMLKLTQYDVDVTSLSEFILWLTFYTYFLILMKFNGNKYKIFTYMLLITNNKTL